ncbi:MAG: RNA 2',3'-cyclic phosphodiesterase [Terriglobales bacterium]
MRIFIGIDLDNDVRAKIARFLDGVRGFAPDARWVRPESLHITLKFIGEQKPERVEAITERLRRVAGNSIEIRFTGHGFFPTAKAPRVFWIGIHAGSELAELAGGIDAAVAELGVSREDRPFSPHLTLARGGGGSRSPGRLQGDGPNTMVAVLQKRLDGMAGLDFGTMTAHEFVLYQSQLSPGGSKYTKLERFPLK